MPLPSFDRLRTNSLTNSARWKDQGAMTVVPRTTAMRSPDRDVLLALIRWFQLNVEER